MSTRELEAGIVRLKADLARAREVILKTTAAVPVRRGGAGGAGVVWLAPAVLCGDFGARAAPPSCATGHAGSGAGEACGAGGSTCAVAGSD